MKPSRRTFLQSLPLSVSLTGLALREGSGAQQTKQTGESTVGSAVDWDAMGRQSFAMDGSLAYFNAGGLGPAPKKTIATVCETIWELQRTPAHGHGLIEQARPIVAGFLGADPNEIAFTRNATEGNSTIAAGLPLRPGDEVILDAHAHPGGSISWMTRQMYDGIRVRAFDPQGADDETLVDRIAEQITPRTKVIQVSHVTAPTGIRMPVEAIAKLAHEHELWFHLDGAQSAGMIPFELSKLGCHSFATSGHKWLCGPTGTGVLYVQRDRLDEVQPTDVGGYANTTWQIPDQLEFVESARRFECGTRDAATVAGLAESVRFLQPLGMPAIAARGRTLAQTLRQRIASFEAAQVLSPAEKSQQTAMVTFAWRDKTADELFRHCLQHQCRCRPVREQGLQALRVSTHLFNSPSELDKLTEALATLG